MVVAEDLDTPAPACPLPLPVVLAGKALPDQRCWCGVEPAVSKLCLIATDAQIDVRGSEIARSVSTLEAISGTGTKYCITEQAAKK